MARCLNQSHIGHPVCLFKCKRAQQAARFFSKPHRVRFQEARVESGHAKQERIVTHQGGHSAYYDCNRQRTKSISVPGVRNQTREQCRSSSDSSQVTSGGCVPRFLRTRLEGTAIITAISRSATSQGCTAAAPLSPLLIILFVGVGRRLSLFFLLFREMLICKRYCLFRGNDVRFLVFVTDILKLQILINFYPHCIFLKHICCKKKVQEQND